MRQQILGRGGFFSGAGIFGPPARDRIIHRYAVFRSDHQRGGRGDGFGARERHTWGVSFPCPSGARIRDTAPEIRYQPPAHVHRDPGAQILPAREALLEGFAHGPEHRIDMTGDVDTHL